MRRNRPRYRGRSGDTSGTFAWPPDACVKCPRKTAVGPKCPRRSTYEVVEIGLGDSTRPAPAREPTPRSPRNQPGSGTCWGHPGDTTWQMARQLSAIRATLAAPERPIYFVVGLNATALQQWGISAPNQVRLPQAWSTKSASLSPRYAEHKTRAS